LRLLNSISKIKKRRKGCEILEKEKQPSFVLTLRLNTESWQTDVLIKHFEVGRKIYNTCLGELYKRYNAMRRTRVYQETIKLSKEDSDKNKTLSKLRKQYRISEYDLHSFIVSAKRHMKALDIHTTQKIASRCYEAFEDVIFAKAKKAHFKKFGTMDSLEGKSNSTGIRFRFEDKLPKKDKHTYCQKDEINKTPIVNTDNCYILWNKLIISVLVKYKDNYAQEALTRTVKYCRIIKKTISCKEVFYVQLVFDGFPPVKKHNKTTGRVGLDIGTQTRGICSNKDVKLIELAAGLNQTEADVRKLQRKLDRSRRTTNPNNYNTNGTVKKGKWIRSKRYLQTLYRFRETQRLYAARKKQSHNELANYILSLGDEIYVESMNFKGLVKRAKKTEINEKGKFKRKKRFGKSILRKSPAMFLSILNQKLGYQNKILHKINTWKVKASQYCHLDDTYKKKPLSKRWNDFENDSIQRDLYSAFLLMCMQPDLETINKELCNSEFQTFKLLHDVEITRLEQLVNISSMGVKKAA